MRRTRLKINRETVAFLSAASMRQAGGQIKETNQEFSCISVNCPTYREITCASNLASCLTQPNYCQ